MLIIKKKPTKRDIIIEKAADLIREKGYVATTMRDLATSVGVEAASLYNHIQSKEQILSEICFAIANHYTDQMNEIYPAQIDSISKIRKLLSAHLKMNVEHSALASVMNDEWRHLSQPDNGKFLEMRHTYEDKFIEIIQQGIKEGSIAPVDPRIALYTLLSSTRWTQHWYHQNTHYDMEALKATIMSMILNGIQVR